MLSGLCVLTGVLISRSFQEKDEASVLYGILAMLTTVAACFAASKGF